MWFGMVMSNEEISERYQEVRNRFEGDKRETIPRTELSKAISEEFDIPNEVAEAYITIALTYYATDWFTILDNAVCLMRTEMAHGIYGTLRAIGKEPTVENAKDEVKELKKLYLSKNNTLN